MSAVATNPEIKNLTARRAGVKTTTHLCCTKKILARLQTRLVQRKKVCLEIIFFPMKKVIYFPPYVCLPPPPRAMLESRIRSRGLAPGCCFSTLRGGAGGPSKSASLETGRNTAFGAFPVYVGATMISAFVATALIWPPWVPRAHRSLQEA